MYIHPHTSFERAFNCRVTQWAEAIDDEGALQFTAICNRTGRVILADSPELLALELSPEPAYRMAA